MTQELRRFSFRLPQPLWILLATVVVSVQPATASNLPDEDESANGSPSEREVENVDSTVYGWVFSASLIAEVEGTTVDTLNTEVARKMLDMLLLKKVAVVDRVCGLRQAQKEKLQLAGRGDNKRILDRVETIAKQLQFVKNDPDKFNELRHAAQLLRRGLRPGLSNTPLGSSLLLKSLETILTSEQLDKYEPLKTVVHAGGQVRLRELGSVEGLEVTLSRSTFTDDDLPRLSKLTGIISLSLAHTPVTDAGLEHLKGLASLLWLSLEGTHVTDAGLLHLEGLTQLKCLWLKSTQVTDAGLVHLKALTNLERVSFYDTQLTDGGLLHLRDSKSLQRLILTRTHVSDNGVADLMRALPDLIVHRGPVDQLLQQ